MSQGPFANFVTRPRNRNEYLANAFALARASQVAYKDADDKDNVTEDAEKELRDWGFQNSEFLGWSNAQFNFTRSTQAYMSQNENIILVCFRGSDMVLDWARDINISFSSDGPFGQVHAGFLATLKEPSGDSTVLGHGLDTVEQVARKTGLPVYLTGHSLGAASATLSAAYLLQRGVDIAGVYTYGSPRVGDPAFAREYDAALKALTHRFVNGEDWVTDLPKKWMGYAHVGTTWVIRDGVVGESDGGPNADSQDFGKIGNTDDHATQLYVDALGKATQEE